MRFCLISFECLSSLFVAVGGLHGRCVVTQLPKGFSQAHLLTVSLTGPRALTSDPDVHYALVRETRGWSELPLTSQHPLTFSSFTS